MVCYGINGACDFIQFYLFIFYCLNTILLFYAYNISARSSLLFTFGSHFLLSWQLKTVSLLLLFWYNSFMCSFDRSPSHTLHYDIQIIKFFPTIFLKDYSNFGIWLMSDDLLKTRILINGLTRRGKNFLAIFVIRSILSTYTNNYSQ